jgi:MFS transporter, SP family, general alpha glucoside:H+ symporter
MKLVFDIVSLGSLIGTLVTWGANQAWGGDVLDNRGWKVPLYVGLAAPTITLIAMALVMPESPYWLTLKDRIEDAKRSLQRLHPNKSPAEIDRLHHELHYTVLKEREFNDSIRDASYWECFRGPNLRRTFCALFPSASQQLVGNQLIQSYSTCKSPSSELVMMKYTNILSQTSSRLPDSVTHFLVASSCPASVLQLQSVLFSLLR